MNTAPDYMKSYRKLKVGELLLVICLEVIYFCILFGNKSLRTAIFSNTLLFTLTCLMWILLLLSLIFFLMDFYLLRTSATQSQELSNAAYMDTLTGLPNRYSVDMIIKMHDKEETMENVGCAVLRISNLVEINNKFGHDAGDTLIQDFCTMLEDVGDHYGFVGRNGGNEFLAILEECDDEKMTQFVADLYVEINLYNMTHASTPISIEYNYALNSNEKTKKLTELFTIVYRKLEEMALS